MRKTTNYGLSLYDKEDKMNITSEENSLNANMEIIDSTLKNKASITDMTNYINEHKDELKGADGKDGANGKDGISTTHSWNGTTLTVTSASGTSSANLKGDKGDTGERGIQGIQGVQGIQGERGLQGEKGDDGYTPIKGTDYFTAEDKQEIVNETASKISVPTKTSQLTNDSGFLTEVELTQEQLDEIIDAVVEAQKVEFVESTDQCTDTSKQYVLPDGYVYAYMSKTVDVVHNANDSNATLNARCSTTAITINSDGTITAPNLTTNAAGNLITGAIKLENKTTPYNVNISGLDKIYTNYFASMYVHYYDASGASLGYLSNNTLGLTSSAEEDFDLPQTVNLAVASYWAKATYVRITLGIKPKNQAITNTDIQTLAINFERLNTTKTEYGWFSTGQKYSSDEVVSQISSDVADLQTRVTALEESGGSGDTEDAISGSGANWYAMGDSITYGGYAPSLTEYKPPIIGQRWVDYVAKYNGYNLTNLGVSGSGFLTGKTFRTIINETVSKSDTENFKNANLVTIMLGINDWKNYAVVDKIGTMNDDISTGGTIISELRYGLEQIIAQNPLCKIILITPLNAKLGGRGTEETNWGYGYAGGNTVGGSLKEFGDKLVEVCKYYGIQTIDMTNSSVVNRKNITSVLGDGLHPTLDGYRVIGLELARKITFA